MSELRTGIDLTSDDAIDHDIILVWPKDEKCMITGAETLGRLLKGIVVSH